MKHTKISTRRSYLVRGKFVNCGYCNKKKYFFPYELKKVNYCSSFCYLSKKKEMAKGARSRVPDKLKKELLAQYDYLCGFCKEVKHEKMMPLQFHHLDDNPKNNKVINLIPLCVSCHRKTMRDVPNRLHIYNQL